jgi:hypothetical protein
VDTTGASSGGVRIGAHQKHLLGGTFGNGVACTTCHSGVAGYAQAHANGTREVGFGGAANANLRLGTFTVGGSGAAGSCAATWCHGGFTGGTPSRG